MTAANVSKGEEGSVGSGVVVEEELGEGDATTSRAAVCGEGGGAGGCGSMTSSSGGKSGAGGTLVNEE